MLNRIEQYPGQPVYLSTITPGNFDLLERAFDDGLIGLFQDVFAEPPHRMHFTDFKVRDIYHGYARHGGSTVVVYDSDAVVGCGTVVPIEWSHIARDLTPNQDLTESWGVESVAILPSY